MYILAFFSKVKRRKFDIVILKIAATNLPTQNKLAPGAFKKVPGSESFFLHISDICMHLRFLLIGLLFTLAVPAGFAQVTEDSLRRQEDPSLDLLSDLDNKKKNTKEKEKKEIKPPKNVYFGIKARKGFTKTGGRRQADDVIVLLPARIQGA
jgi:hypothetical protein